MELEILKIASNTTNLKEIDIYTHKSEKKNPMCGDIVTIEINVKKNKIQDIGYKSKSCIYCQASASLLSNFLVNQKLEKARLILKSMKIFYNDKNYIIKGKLKKIFNKKNYKRKECIYLPVRAISDALKFKI
tara:strand:- start:324 stop:719 length:396 start_codon:yes stop_codon:yes gene_type:complete